MIGTDFRRQKEGEGQNLKHTLEQIFDAAERGRAKSKFEWSCLGSQVLYLELCSNQVKAGANKTGNKFVIGTNFRRQKEGGQNLKHRLEQIFDAAERGRAKSKFESSCLWVVGSW